MFRNARHDLIFLLSFVIVYVGSRGQQKLMYPKIWRMTLPLLLSPTRLYLSHQLAQLRTFSTATGARPSAIRQRKKIALNYLGQHFQQSHQSA